MKFLVIRTDNIGDLVCTTPLIHSLRKHYPHARICAFVNSYNAPVLHHNPDLNKVYAYTKGKHRSGQTLVGVYWQRLKLMLQLRRERFDYAILAGAGLRHKGLQLARQLGIKHIIGYTEADKVLSKHITMGVPYIQDLAQHEVENTHKLLSVLNIHDAPGALTVIADSYKIAEANARLKHAWPSSTVKKPIGVHISARLPSNRWVEGHYIELIRKLWERHQQPVLLFWSPGDENNALHPGDDQKAARIVQALNNIPVLPYATHELAELIAGLSLCKILICSDGGAMHVAAGLKKPLICFFGETEVKHWYPWKVPHKILQPQSGKVADVSVDEAFEAFESLLSEYQHEISHHN